MSLTDDRYIIPKMFCRNALLIFTLDDKFVKLYDISVGPVDKLGLTGGVFTPESVIPIKDGADNPDC